MMSSVYTTGLERFDIYTGFWINWSRGKYAGATLTLSREDGGLLIAFLAFFIGVVGNSFWRLVCFGLHRYFSRPSPQDAVYHQCQAILRNCETSQNAVLNFFNLLFAWKQRAKRPISRLLPLVVLAIVVTCGSTVAGIFSSRVTTDTANEVLLTGSKCAHISNGGRNVSNGLIVSSYQAKRAPRFLNYGLGCYLNSTDTNTDGCSTYVKPQLKLFVNRNATCPFKTKICKTQTGNLILDSGYIDSNNDLGINSDPRGRIQMRIVHQCAPLQTKGYIKIHNHTLAGTVFRYMYGTVREGFSETPWTYEQPFDFRFVPMDGTGSGGMARIDYQVGVLSHRPHKSRNSWTPIPELRSAQADLFLVFIASSGIVFSQRVDDLVFHAHRQGPLVFRNGSASAYSYKMDEPAGVLACKSSIQFCSSNLPASRRCEPLRAFGFANQSLGPDPKYSAQVGAMENSLSPNMYTISDFFASGGSRALMATYGLNYNIQGPLPSNQWQLEAEHWFKGQLASIQGAFVSVAAGPSTPELERVAVKPPKNNPTYGRFQKMCKNQKIITTRYFSFNVLGLGSILVFGSIIIILNLSLEPLDTFFRRRRYRQIDATEKSGDNLPLHTSFQNDPHPLYSHLEWTSTGTLQLQRLAHERAGCGTWSKTSSDHPTTLLGEKLAVLDITDIEHPVLRAAEIGLNPSVHNSRQSLSGSQSGDASSVYTEQEAADMGQETSHQSEFSDDR